MSTCSFVGRNIAIVVGFLFLAVVVSCGTCFQESALPEYAPYVLDEVAALDDNDSMESSEGAEGSDSYLVEEAPNDGYYEDEGWIGERRRPARRAAKKRSGRSRGGGSTDDPLAGLDDDPPRRAPSPAVGDGDPDITIGQVEIEEPTMLSLVDLVLSKLALGNIAFNTPERMYIQTTETVELLLSTKETTEQLAAAVKGRPVETAEGVRVAPEMQADLRGQGFKIEAVTPTKQVVSNLQRTRWAWTVTAIKGGKQTLDLSLSARVQVDGKDSPFVVKTFSKTIVVEVSPWKPAKDFLANNWQWLWTTILVPIGIWYRTRKKKTAPEPPAQDEAS